MDGTTLPPGKRNSRRKHLTKKWTNADWLRRLLGVCQYLGGQNGTMTWGNNDDDQLIIDMTPLTFHAPRGIDEAKLDESKQPIEAFFAEDDLENGE